MTGAISSLQCDYYSNPTAVPMQLGYVRTATPYAVGGLLLSSANYTYFMRVIEGGIIRAIRLTVTVQSGNICLAIYKNTGSALNALPDSQVITTGSIPCPNVGTTDIPLGKTVSVVAGDWFSFGADNTTAAVLGKGGLGPDPAVAGLFAAQNAYPAPAVAAAAAANNRTYSLVGVP